MGLGRLSCRSGETCGGLRAGNHPSGRDRRLPIEFEGEGVLDLHGFADRLSFFRTSEKR
jgi:hypothetical protein